VLADVLNTENVNEYFEMSLRDEIEMMGVILERGEKRKLKKRSKTAYIDKEYEEVPNAVAVHWVTKITKPNRSVRITPRIILR
jgi:hypothetical protein